MILTMIIIPLVLLLPIAVEDYQPRRVCSRLRPMTSPSRQLCQSAGQPEPLRNIHAVSWLGNVLAISGASPSPTPTASGVCRWPQRASISSSSSDFDNTLLGNEPSTEPGVIFARILPDRETLLTVTESKVVRLSCAVRGKQLAQFAIDELAWPFALDLSHDGRTLAAASGAGVSLWNVYSGKKTKTELRFSRSQLTAHICFSPDDKVLAVVNFIPITGSSFPTSYWLDLYDATTGIKIEECAWFRCSGVSSVLFSPDGQSIVVSGDRFRVFEVNSGKKKGTS